MIEIVTTAAAMIKKANIIAIRNTNPSTGSSVVNCSFGDLQVP
jgi:hypothetical protein